LLQYFVVFREIVDQVFDEVQFMAIKRWQLDHWQVGPLSLCVSVDPHEIDNFSLCSVVRQHWSGRYWSQSALDWLLHGRL